MRFFNNAGPSVAGQHYMIDPLERLDLPEVLAMIEQQRYFVLHAPRQTGKTTSLLALVDYLNKQGEFYALYVNIEAAQTARQDVARGMRAITTQIAENAAYDLDQPELESWCQELLERTSADRALNALLAKWARASDRPIVLMLDEVDALIGDTLISLLRQIRAGYTQRPKAFPQSVILCGVRDVRDYRIHTSHQEIITGGSAFNIKATSLRLGNLSRQEVEALYQQHTQETGQTFAPAIFAELWEDTRGQPWLVNALGYELTWHDRELRDRSIPIDLECYRLARERLIHSRATHLDQLTDKLREERVRRVVMALMEGAEVEDRLPPDEVQYVEDLGLITSYPQLRIANRIYQEVLPREITWTMQAVITQETPWYVEPDQRLNMAKLLTAFQQFFREHSQAWLERFEYQEAGPQLLLQAFLQRIVNGGGRISREYGLGRRRTDLCLEWPLDGAQGHYGPVQRVVLELKILHKGLKSTIAEGLEQTADYADRCGAEEAHLLIFDRREGVSWDEKIWSRAEGYQGREIQVWGC
jgi:hypothetical protein